MKPGGGGTLWAKAQRLSDGGLRDGAGSKETGVWKVIWGLGLWKALNAMPRSLVLSSQKRDIVGR